MYNEELVNGTVLTGKFASYVLTGVLGRGGFGITYSATDNHGGEYAIKEFFPKTICSRTQGCDDLVIDIDKIETVTKLRHRFVRECENIIKCDQPNIVHIIETFEKNGTSYIVMELVNGRTLKEIVQSDGPIKESDAVRIIRQIASALSYLHANKITHLDVKPDNIIYDATTDKAVLIDFGLSRQYNDDGSSNSMLVRAVSTGYAAVEQYGSSVNQFTPESDIYSLGATLYKLITGTTPPDSLSRLDNPGALKVPTSMSLQVASAIRAAMAVQRSERINSIDTFLKLLDGKIKYDDAVKIVKKNKRSDKKTPRGEVSKDKKQLKKHSPVNIVSNIILAAVAIVIAVFAAVNYDLDTHDYSEYFFYMKNKAYIPASIIVTAASLCLMFISRRAAGFKLILSLIMAAGGAALILNFMLG